MAKKIWLLAIMFAIVLCLTGIARFVGISDVAWIFGIFLVEFIVMIIYAAGMFYSEGHTPVETSASAKKDTLKNSLPRTWWHQDV